MFYLTKHCLIFISLLPCEIYLCNYVLPLHDIKSIHHTCVSSIQNSTTEYFQPDVFPVDIMKAFLKIYQTPITYEMVPYSQVHRFMEGANYQMGTYPLYIDVLTGKSNYDSK